jgi:hypothetical protein
MIPYYYKYNLLFLIIFIRGLNPKPVKDFGSPPPKKFEGEKYREFGFPKHQQQRVLSIPLNFGS